MDSIHRETELPKMMAHHHAHSVHAHEKTHEKLDDVEESMDELEKAVERGKHSYHHHGEKGYKMYDSSGAGGLFGGGAGGVLGGGIGGLIGGALGSGLFGHHGGHGGHYGGGYGYGGNGCCNPCSDAETRIEDAIHFAEATGQRFDLERDLGDIKREIECVGNKVSAELQRSMFEMQIAACQANAAQLMAIEQTKYASVTATKDAQTAIIHNQDRIAYEQLRERLELERRDNERRHNDLNIQVIQNQNVAQAQQQQQQMALLEERNARRADRSDFMFNNILAQFQAQMNQQNVQNKSVTIGAGTSNANSTNTANNV